jgi:hypothetical protein
MAFFGSPNSSTVAAEVTAWFDATNFADEKAAARCLKRDDFSSNRHPALSSYLSMVFSENRYPLFGIML